MLHIYDISRLRVKYHVSPVCINFLYCATFLARRQGNQQVYYCVMGHTFLIGFNYTRCISYRNNQHFEQLRNIGIINSTTRSHLVGYFYTRCTYMCQFNSSVTLFRNNTTECLADGKYLYECAYFNDIQALLHRIRLS